MATAKGIRAGRAFVELFADDSQLVRGLRMAQQRLAAFGTAVRQIGQRVTAAGSAMVAPIVAAALKFGAAGSALNDLSQRTGVSAEALSELAHAAEMSGTSIEALGGALFRMRRRIANAATGGGPAVRAMRELGDQAKAITQLPVEEQFMHIVAALEGVENESLRAQYAFEIFGDGAKALLPLLNQGTAGISALRQQARELGITLTDEDAAAAVEFSDAVGILKKSLGAIITQIGAAVAPILADMANRIRAVTTRITHWVRANRALVVGALKIAAAVVAAGAAMVALGIALNLIAAGFGVLARAVTLFGKGLSLAIAGVKLLMAPMVILKAVGSALATVLGVLAKGLMLLFTPIGLVVAALGSLAAYMVYASGVGGKALQWLGQHFSQLASSALRALQGMGDAIAAGDLALAAKILWLTLQMEWRRGVAALNNTWASVRDFFLATWTEAVYGAAGIAVNAWAGLQVGWIETVDFLRDAWTVFTTFLTTSWHRVIGFIQKAWVRLKALFDDDIDVDAEVARINREVEGATSSADRERDQILVERERARRERRQQIESGRTGALAALDQMREEEHAARRRATDAELAEMEKSLDAARKEWAAANEEAARKRKQAATSEPELLKDFRAQLSGLAGLLADIGAQRTGAGGFGSFSGMAASRQGWASPIDRQVKAINEVRDEVAQMRRQLSGDIRDTAPQVI